MVYTPSNQQRKHQNDQSPIPTRPAQGNRTPSNDTVDIDREAAMLNEGGKVKKDPKADSPRREREEEDRPRARN